MSLLPSSTTSLGLDDHGDHPRRFLKWNDEFLLAYGGDDGTLTMLVTSAKGEYKTDEHRWIKVRQWDDAIRAIAISPNGKRVAVGFDTGAITIYAYDDFKSNSDNGKQDPHPFFHKAWQKWQRRQKQDKGTNDDDDHGLLSQPSSSVHVHDDDDDDDALMNDQDEVTFPGPPMEAPIRDLQFDPRCGSSMCPHQYLAIATEAGFCISNASSSQTLLPLLLQEVGEKEHNASGIRSLAYTIDSDRSNATTSTLCLLSTLAMDGRVCFWNVTQCSDPELDWELYHRDASKCIIKPDIGELNGADAADRSCRPCPIQHGSMTTTMNSNNITKDIHCALVAFPGQTDILLRPTRQLGQQHFLPSIDGQGHIEPIVAMTCASWNNHDYLVTSGRDGRVNLWKLPSVSDDAKSISSNGRLLAQIGQYASIPTDLCWIQKQPGPKLQEMASCTSVLYIACANGTCEIVQNVDRLISPTKEIQADKSAKTQNVKVKATTASTSAQVKSVTTKPHEDSKAPKSRSEFVDDEAEDDENVGGSGPHDDTDGDDDDDATVEMITALKDSFVDKTVVPRADNRTNNPPQDPPIDGGDDYDDDEEEDFNNQNDSGPGFVNQRLSLSLPKPQAAFAPSSTPLDMTRRILCWNNIGVISLLRGDDELVRNMVKIEFTDVTLRRPISFTDNMNFILGALGESGAIFASDLQEDEDDDDGMDEDLLDGLNVISERTKAMLKKSQRQRMRKSNGHKSTGSNVYFHRFDTFAALRDKDWFLSLPDGERALGCACGEGWAAVATSRRFLRFFTLGGNQGQVLWLKGDLVTMVGRSRFLAVIFHEANPLVDGTQKLGYALFDAVDCRIVSQGSLSCVSTRSELSWAGFSNDYSLMVMDTDGMLSMLFSTSGTDGCAEPLTSSSWEWTPILDTVGLRKSTEDTIWPIAVQDGKLVCVPLKGGKQFPDATRRPVTATLSLRMPMARGTMDKITNLEEVSVRANLALNQKRAIFDSMISRHSDMGNFEEGFQAMCAQVDKVTLQLYRALLEAGKLERALDLVCRLHLEKSFDIAITMADHFNHRSLSNRIEEYKFRWLCLKFPSEENDQQVDHDDEFFDVEENFEDICDRNHLQNSKFDSSSRSDMQQPIQSNITGPVRRISPDSHTNRALKRPIHHVEKKSKNPFAKKRLESPAQTANLGASANSPVRLHSPTPKISRASTFSTKSRELTKASKNLL